MTTDTTLTCICGSHGFIIVNALTGDQVDLKTWYATRPPAAIDPANLKRHDPLDVSHLQMVCANPGCRRILR